MANLENMSELLHDFRIICFQYFSKIKYINERLLISLISRHKHIIKIKTTKSIFKY